ncbi:hypothetical protein GH714_011664 [Hevea brasiliensis]|uniref:AB hydrolase-1 domain-containing protein n=1 Tax=Hevea brasiliensis TaxID=3981 RepID=A0A6A6NGM5_HEVBR|nr:hypothetical protein GH714_011664 [Hevea brasiliensis]
MGTTLLEALNVRVVGSGEKILVLAHGFGTDQSAWQRILPFFTQNYSIILYDLVCAGSVNPDHFDFERYTSLHAYVDDLLNILDALRVDRCSYVGHSVSAMVGLLASIRRPELFSKLILIGASPRFLNDKDYHGGFERADIENVFVAMEANYEAWVNGFAPLAVGRMCRRRPSQGTLLHNSDIQGRVRTSLGGGVFEDPFGWGEHGRIIKDRGSFATFECPSVVGSSAPASPFAMTMCVVLCLCGDG